MSKKGLNKLHWDSSDSDDDHNILPEEEPAFKKSKIDSNDTDDDEDYSNIEFEEETDEERRLRERDEERQHVIQWYAERRRLDPLLMGLTHYNPGPRMRALDQLYHIRQGIEPDMAQSDGSISVMDQHEVHRVAASNINYDSLLNYFSEKRTASEVDKYTFMSCFESVFNIGLVDESQQQHLENIIAKLEDYIGSGQVVPNEMLCKYILIFVSEQNVEFKKNLLMILL